MVDNQLASDLDLVDKAEGAKLINAGWWSLDYAHRRGYLPRVVLRPRQVRYFRKDVLALADRLRRRKKAV
jgi:hypothetical protein